MQVYRLAVGVVNWVPEQLNIKAVTGACKLIAWLQPCAVFGPRFSGFSWHIPQKKVDSIAWLNGLSWMIVSYTLHYIPSTDWALYCWCRLGTKDKELENIAYSFATQNCSLKFVHKIDQSIVHDILTTTFDHDILSTTFCPRLLSTTLCPRYSDHDILSKAFCPRHFVRDILSNDILSS